MIIKCVIRELNNDKSDKSPGTNLSQYTVHTKIFLLIGTSCLEPTCPNIPSILRYFGESGQAAWNQPVPLYRPY